MENDWIRLTEDNLATAFGPDASYLLLHHRKQLDSLLADLQAQDRINNAWRDSYGESAVQYQRNTHFLFNRFGVVKAAGNAAHMERYMQPNHVVVIRDSQVPEEQPCF